MYIYIYIYKISFQYSFLLWLGGFLWYNGWCVMSNAHEKVMNLPNSFLNRITAFSSTSVV